MFAQIFASVKFGHSLHKILWRTIFVRNLFDTDARTNKLKTFLVKSISFIPINCLGFTLLGLRVSLREINLISRHALLGQIYRLGIIICNAKVYISKNTSVLGCSLGIEVVLFRSSHTSTDVERTSHLG